MPYYRSSDRMEAAKHLRLMIARYIADRALLSDVREAMAMLESAALAESNQPKKG